ncbi:MAG: hypothetical protein ACO1RA_19800 [Planctomycetaceae bacterium]
MSSHSRWLLWGLFWTFVIACDHAVQGADPEEVPPQAHPQLQRIFVAEKELQRVAQGMVPLDRQEFIDAWKRLHQPFELAAPPGLNLVEAEATLDASGTLQGSMQFSWEKGATLAPRIPLGKCSMAVANPRWKENSGGENTNPVYLGNDSKLGLVLVANQPGPAICDWSLSPVSGKGNPWEYTVQLPQASRRLLTLTLPEGIQVEVDGDLIPLQEERLTNSGTNGTSGFRRWKFANAAPQWKGAEVGVGRIRLLRPGNSTSRPKFLLYQQTSTGVMSPADLLFETSFSCETIGGSFSECTLRLPADVKLLSCKLNQEEVRFQPLDSGETSEITYRLTFAKPLIDKGNLLQVQGVLPLSTGNPWTLPNLTLEQGKWQEGTWQVSIDPRVQLRIASLQACELMGATTAEGNAGREQLKWKLFSPKFAANLVLLPIGQQLKCTSGTTLTVEPLQTTVVVQTQLECREQPLFDVQLLIPRRWIVDSLETNPPDLLEDRSVSTPRGDFDKIQLRLREPVTSNKPLLLTIRAHRPRTADEDNLPEDLLPAVVFPQASQQESWLKLLVAAPNMSADFYPSATFLPVAGSQVPGEIQSLLAASAEGKLLKLPTTGLMPTIRLTTSVTSFDAEQNLHYEVTKDRLRGEVRMLCKPEGGLVSRLRVRASQPPTGTISWEIVGEGAEGLSILPMEQKAGAASSADAVTGWLLELRRPRLAPFEIVARFEQSKQDAQELPLFSFVEAAHETGELSLAIEGESRFEIATQEMREVPTTEPLSGNTIRTRRQKYLYAPSQAAQITLRELPASKSSPLAWMESCQISTFLNGDQPTLHEAICGVHNLGIEQLGITLPEGCSILQVALAAQGGLLDYAVDSQGKATVLLPVNQDFVWIRLVFSTPASAVGQQNWISQLSGTPLSAPMPKFSIPVRQCNWKVYVGTGEVAERNAAGRLDTQGENTLRFLPRNLFSLLESNGAEGSPLGLEGLGFSSPFVKVHSDANLRRALRIWFAGTVPQKTGNKPITWLEIFQSLESQLSSSSNLQDPHLWVAIDELSSCGIRPAESPAWLLTGPGEGSIEELFQRAFLELRLESGRLVVGRATSSDWKDVFLPTISPGDSTTASPEFERHHRKLASWDEAGALSVNLEPTLASPIAPWRWRNSTYRLELPVDSELLPMIRVYRRDLLGMVSLAGLLISLWLIICLPARTRVVPWCVAACLGFATLAVPLAWAAFFSGGVWGALAGILFRFFVRNPQKRTGEPNANEASQPRHSTPSRTLGTATLGLLLFAFSTLAFGQPPKANEKSAQSEKTWTVVIPTDEDGKPAGEYVYVSPEFFDLLKGEPHPEEKATSAWLGLKSRWEMELTNENAGANPAPAHLKLVYDFQVFASDTTALLPFSRDQVTPLTGRLFVDGQPSVWQWDSNGKGLQIEHLPEGRHRIELEVAAAIQKESGDLRSLQILVPRAATQELWVTSEQAPTQVEVATAQRQIPQELPAGTLYLLPSSDSLSVKWQKLALASEQQSHLQAEQTVWWRLTPELAWGEWHLRLTSRDDQSFSDAIVAMDSSVQLLPITESSGFSIQREELRPDGKQKVLYLRMVNPTKRAELRIPVATAWQAAQKKFAPPWLQPMVEQWTTSGIVVTNCPGQELDTNHELAAAPLKSTELSNLFPALVGKTDWHGFEMVPGGTAGEFHFSSISTRLNQSDSTTYFLAGTTGEFTTVVSLTGGRFPATPIDISYSEPINVQQLRIVWGGEEIPSHWHASGNHISIIPLASASGNKGQVIVHGTFAVADKEAIAVPLYVPVNRHQRSQLWFQHYPGIDVEALTKQGFQEGSRANNPTEFPWESGITLTSDTTSDEVSRKLVVRLVGQPTQWHLEQTTSLEAAAGIWTTEIRLRGQVSEGKLHAVFFRSTSEIETTMECVDLQTQKPLRVLAHGDGLHEVQMPSPVTDEFSIRIRAQVVTAKDQILRLPKVVVLDATSRQEFVKLPVSDGAQRVGWETRGLDLIDTSTLEGSLPSDNSLLYRVLSSQYAAEIRDASELLREPECPWADYALTLLDRKHFSAQGTFWIDPAGLSSVEVELAKGYELVAILRDGRILEGRKTGENRWKLPLGNSTLPTQLRLLFRGELSLRQTEAAFTPIRIVELKPTSTTWRILESSRNHFQPMQSWNLGFSAKEPAADLSAFAGEYLRQIDGVLNMSEHTLQVIRTSETQSRQAAWTRIHLAQLAQQMAPLSAVSQIPSWNTDGESQAWKVATLGGDFQKRWQLSQLRWEKILREGTGDSFGEGAFVNVLLGKLSLNTASKERGDLLLPLDSMPQVVRQAGVSSNGTQEILIPIGNEALPSIAAYGSLLLLAVVPLVIVLLILRNPKRLLPLASTPQLVPMCIGILWMLWGPIAELSFIPLLCGIYLTLPSFGNRKTRGGVLLQGTQKSPTAA